MYAVQLQHSGPVASIHMTKNFQVSRAAVWMSSTSSPWQECVDIREFLEFEAYWEPILTDTTCRVSSGVEEQFFGLGCCFDFCLVARPALLGASDAFVRSFSSGILLCYKCMLTGV